MTVPEMETTLEGRASRLGAILQELDSVLVAYSGGVDSAYLLKAAVDTLGERAIGLIADSPSLARAEFTQALAVAREIGARLEVATTAELENPEYQRNAPNRCYFCKSELFAVSAGVAQRLGLAHVVYGANRDDVGDFRPGMAAARERGIRAPLLDAGLSKADVRELARRAGLSVWDKPSFACLASRIPHGTPVTVERLSRVEQAEAVLRRHGFRQFRVRDLDSMARVEVEPEDLPRLMAEPLRLELLRELRAVGFAQVAVDLEGFRSGRLNAPGLVGSDPGLPGGWSGSGAG